MIVACVRTGQKYSVEYVLRLKAAVGRHLKTPHEFVCLTDNPHQLPSDIKSVPVRSGLHGWWGKFQLFEPSWRSGERVIYLDLDTVLVGDVSPLADVKSDFAICANFTVIHQRSVAVTGGERPTWPCRYGSMCMVIGPALNGHVWDSYNKDREGIQRRAGFYGDQKALEMIEPNADLLQPMLPEGFFLGYRDLSKHPDKPPPGAAVIVFAGKNKPHNTECKWARNAWRNWRN